MIRVVPMANGFQDIITRLERQRASIDRALAALREVDDTDVVSAPALAASRSKGKRNDKRPLSAEARARMAEGQKKRWAAKRAAAKKSVKKTTRKRGVKEATSKEE